MQCEYHITEADIYHGGGLSAEEPLLQGMQSTFEMMHSWKAFPRLKKRAWLEACPMSPSWSACTCVCEENGTKLMFILFFFPLTLSEQLLMERLRAFINWATFWAVDASKYCDLQVATQRRGESLYTAHGSRRDTGGSDFCMLQQIYVAHAARCSWGFLRT